MATRGYAATSISDIRKACGLPASSIYWHFGSKDGVLAAVMERGADRFFAAIPSSGSIDEQLSVLADLQAQRPEFLRILYLLSLERGDDPTVTAVVRRVRDTAIARFSAAVRSQLPAGLPPRRIEQVVAELTAFAVAQSDGVFFAAHLDPATTDVARMYRRLWQAVTVLIPILLEEQ